MNFKPDDFKPKKPDNGGGDANLQPGGDLNKYMDGLMAEAERREAAEEAIEKYVSTHGDKNFDLN